MTRFAVKREVAADRVRPAAHVVEAEMFACRGLPPHLRVEADAVVDDGEIDPPVIPDQSDVDL